MGVSGAVNQNQEYGLVLIHFPMRGATRHAEQQQRLQRISIRAPREGSDDSEADQILCEDDFNPRSPRGERPAASTDLQQHQSFNPRSPRGERPRAPPLTQQAVTNFNPRSPRGERQDLRATRANAYLFQSTLPARGATQAAGRSPKNLIFQSTLPARGATILRPSCHLLTGYFNPRSPRGERRFSPRHNNRPLPISIQAPREGSDPGCLAVCRSGRRFQSTLPARGATYRRRGTPCNTAYFNPRSPRGERRVHEGQRKAHQAISIHAPGEGSDRRN